MSNQYWLLILVIIVILIGIVVLFREYTIRNTVGGFPTDSSVAKPTLDFPAIEGLIDLTEKTVREVNASVKVNDINGNPLSFSVSDAEMPEYIDLLKNQIQVNKEMGTKDLGYSYKGTYWDGPNRRLPNRLDNVGNADDCKKQAIAKGYNIYGLQYYGECWAGNDQGRAISYGKTRNQNPVGNLGEGWQNNVYMKSIDTVENISGTGYADLVSWMLQNGITDFKTLKQLVDINTSQSGFSTMTEGFREGLGPPAGQKPDSSKLPLPIVTPLASNGVKNEPTINSILDCAKESGFQIVKDDVPQLKSIIGSSTSSKKNCGQFKSNVSNGFMNSSQLGVLRAQLTKLGLPETISIDTAITKFNKQLKVPQKGYLATLLSSPAFVNACKNFGLSERKAKLLNVIDLAEKMGVSENTTQKERLSFADFVNETRIIGLNVDNMDGFDKACQHFYYNIDSTAQTRAKFKRFINECFDFDKKTNKKGMDRFIANVKLLKEKHKLHYIYYTHLIDYLNTCLQQKIITSLGGDMNTLFNTFTEYYYIYEGKTPSKTPLTHINLKIQNFIEVIKKNSKCTKPLGDFNQFLQKNIATNTGKSNICTSQIGGSKPQGMTTLQDAYDYGNPSNQRDKQDSIVEGMENNKVGLNTVYTSLGVTNTQQIPVDMNGKKMSENELDGFLQSSFRLISGQQGQDDKLLLLRTFANMQMPMNQLTDCINILKSFGIVSMDTFKQIFEILVKMGISSYTDITQFLTTLTKFGVSFATLSAFSDVMKKFGLDYTVHKDLYYPIFKLLSAYGIQYRMSMYDSCNTKFTNFVNNLNDDGIYFSVNETREQSFYVAYTIASLLLRLNNSQPPNPRVDYNSLTDDQKRKLDKNMRDLIIARNKQLYSSAYGSSTFMQCNNQFPSKISNLDSIANDYKPVPKFLFELDEKTGKETPMFAGIIIPENTYPVSTKILKTRLTYAFSFANLPNKDSTATDAFANFSYDNMIVPNLTHAEYAQFKSKNPNLLPSVVMSRLYMKLYAQAKSHKDKREYLGYNGYVELLNTIRTLPYLSFRMIAKTIRSQTNADGTNPKYDEYNNPDYRHFNDGVAPIYPETGDFGSEYQEDDDEDESSGTISNTVSGSGLGKKTPAPVSLKSNAFTYKK